MSFDHCDLVPMIVRLLPIDLRVQLCKTYYERRGIRWDTIFVRYFNTHGAVTEELCELMDSYDIDYWSDERDGRTQESFTIDLERGLTVTMRISMSSSSIRVNRPGYYIGPNLEDSHVALCLYFESIADYCARHTPGKITLIRQGETHVVLHGETSCMIAALLSNRMEKRFEPKVLGHLQ